MLVLTPYPESERLAARGWQADPAEHHLLRIPGRMHRRNWYSHEHCRRDRGEQDCNGLAAFFQHGRSPWLEGRSLILTFVPRVAFNGRVYGWPLLRQRCVK